MNKKMNLSGITNELEQGSAFFRGVHASSGQQTNRSVPALSQGALSRTYLPRKTNSGKPKDAQLIEQKVEQSFEQMSKQLTTEAIEALSFRLRKIQKTKVNTEVPDAWKERLDDLAYRLGVGKYELLLYIIGDYLGELESTRGMAQG